MITTLISNILRLLLSPFGIYVTDRKYKNCEKCRRGYLDLTTVNRSTYAYVPEYTLSEQISFDDSRLKIYGWAIEVLDKKYNNLSWQNQWNHKIYNTKMQAVEAINQIRLSDPSIADRIEYRVIPMYKADQSFYRNIIINKVLKK